VTGSADEQHVPAIRPQLLRGIVRAADERAGRSVEIAARREYADVAGMAMHWFVFGHFRARQQSKIGAAVYQPVGHQMNHAFRAFLHFAFRQQ
jgi:hypothetical protein